MDVADPTSFLRDHHHAVLHTFRGDRTPQLSPVLAVVDEGGRVLVSSRETAMKVKNLQRDARAALCAFTDRFFGDWVVVRGTAEVVQLPEAMELLVEYYRRAVGEHPDWEDYRAAMERERRVVIRIHVDDAGPDVAG